MKDLPPKARRIRAALVYAFGELDYVELGRRLDQIEGASGKLKGRTVREFTSGRLTDPDPWQLDLIADACGVPRWFLSEGLPEIQPADDPTIGEEVEALRHEMDTVLSILRTQFAAAAGSPAPADAGGRGDDRRKDPPQEPGAGGQT